MNLLLLVPFVFASKYGSAGKKATGPTESPPVAGAQPCNRQLTLTAEGLSACGQTVTFTYPARPITDMLGPWSRTWKPEGEGVLVQKYVYDELGLTVREPSDGPAGEQAVMLELTCDESNQAGPFADEPFAGTVGVPTPSGQPLKVGCPTRESEFLVALEASGLEYSKTDWASYRIPLGDNELAVGFPLEFQRPSPESDVPVSYIELRPLKK
jgi:hypothetical protein